MFTMKACEGKIGRVFVIRLEDGDVVPECIERFAKKKRVSMGQAILVGGIGSGDVAVGP
jgi:predicted DNA-binding protein with PD1-like motif